MLAARLDLAHRTLSMLDVPDPEPGPGQLRVKVAAAGVCLSDVHLVDGSLSPTNRTGAVTLGHEVAGTVDAVGPDVPARRVGERVLLQAGEVADGRVYTRGVDYDGGWAEYALATATTAVPIPDGLAFEQAAIIPDAVTTPWSAVTATAAVRPAEPVGVWGVGGLGMHAVALLRLVGAAPVVAVDPLPAARARATAAGADLALDPADPDFAARVGEVTAGRGLAAAFDFAGVTAAREQAIAVLAPAGRLVLVGLVPEPLTVADSVRFAFLRQQVRGHYGSGLGASDDVADLLRLTELGRLDLTGSITEVLPLAEAPEAVRRLAAGDGDIVRLVLRP